MKICLVTSAYRPYLSGVSEHVHHLALSLHNRGHQVSILTTCFPTFSRHNPETEKIDFPVTRIGRALVLPAHGGHFTLPAGLNLARQVKNYLAEYQPDLVHCHGIFPPEICYWAAVSATVPVVVTFHTVSPRVAAPFQTAFRICFRRLVNRVSRRIAVSQACASWAQGWFPGEIAVIPNGVDTEKFHPSAWAPKSVETPSILYVSRLDKRKGLPVLLRALPGVKRVIPEIKLLVVGAGPLESACRRLTHKLGLDNAVRFCGFVSPEDLPAWYAGCTVFCAPTLKPEAMGIILLEAMACGKPVVASRIPGYDEVITHGRNGLLFPPGDSEALTEVLLKVLTSSTYRESLSRQALADAQEYSWRAVAARIEQVYRTLTEQ